MRGGTLSCRRESFDKNCINLKCIDRDISHEPFDLKECNAKNHDGWEQFYDTEANAKYYYNHRTGEATWLKPNGFGGGYRKRAARFSKKRACRRRRTRKH